MKISELFFEKDSELVLNLLKLNKQDDIVDFDKFKWLFSLKRMDYILNCFNYSMEDKCHFLENLKMGFYAEFSPPKVTKKNISKKYDIYKANIHSVITNGPDASQEISIMNQLLFGSENNNIINVAKEILELKQANKLEVDINGLLSSYIHMFMNRLFSSSNRAYELVCYDFLARFYRSNVELLKKKNQNEMSSGM